MLGRDYAEVGLIRTLLAVDDTQGILSSAGVLLILWRNQSVHGRGVVQDAQSDHDDHPFDGKPGWYLVKKVLRHA